MLHPRSLKRLTGHLQGMIQGRLWLKIIIALILGIGTGIALGPTTGIVTPEMAATLGSWVAIPGQIFLSLIQMIVVPLVFASIIRGLAASEDMEQLRKVGIRLVIYFIITTTIAISIGLFMATVIRPGDFIDTRLIEVPMEEGQPNNGEPMEPPSLGNFPQLVVGLLPANPLGAMVEREMLHVVLFSIIIGMALVAIEPKRSEPLLDLLGSLQEVCMTVVRWAMYLAPLAVFGLIAQITIRVGLDVLLGLAVYVGTVIGGLVLMLMVYLLIVFLVSRKPPLVFLSAVRDVQLLAFSTSSSAAVMPLSIETAEDKLYVRKSISQFLIPLGATINMDGTALYQGVATVFLAQVYGIELTLPALLLVVVTTVAASIGSPATPGVGIVILSMVLNSVGIPPSGIALIIGVDRILDMCRTAINVTGDLTAAVVMDRWVGGKRTPEEEQAEEENC
jgi:Na+/H+-dicarboxylate symporter